MTNEEKLTLLIEWDDRIKAVNTNIDKWIDIGLDINSDILDSIFKLQTAYTTQISTLIGDENDWLTWWSESDNNRIAYRVTGEKIKLDTLEDLLRYISE